jgi:hypothetical protein
MMEDNGVNDVVFQVRNEILLIKENLSVRMFPDEKSYSSFVEAAKAASEEAFA